MELPRKRIGYYISATLAVALLICLWFVDSKEKNTAEKLAAFGEEQFRSLGYSYYINYIEADKIDDVDCQLTFSYVYGQDYDKDTKTLTLKCVPSDYTSENINQYYTEQYDSEAGKELYDAIHRVYVRTVASREYRYEMDGVGTVVVVVAENESYGITLTTRSGREYRYDAKGLNSVKIDGVCVYQETQDTSYTNSGTTSGDESNSDVSSARHTDAEAWSCAQDIVRSKLKSPSTADFCSFTDCTVIHEGNGHYKVTGWVDAQNALGAVVREYFTVTYTATEDGYKNGSVSFS